MSKSISGSVKIIQTLLTTMISGMLLRVRLDGIIFIFTSFNWFVGLRKELEAAAKQKDCNIIGNWQRSIINHLYWCVSCYSHLRLFNYFFFLSWPFNLPCTHLGNFKFLILVSVLVVNMIIKGHYLASMVLLSPSGVNDIACSLITTHTTSCFFLFVFFLIQSKWEALCFVNKLSTM